MVIAQFTQQKNDQEGNQKHIINFSWPNLDSMQVMVYYSICPCTVAYVCIVFEQGKDMVYMYYVISTLYMCIIMSFLYVSLLPLHVRCISPKIIN